MYNILVCDDDREIVDAIEIYLTQEGYHVLKAYDGMQAIQMLEREEIQLLIIDVMMPKLDGIRATLKIREKSSIPIIILSAKSEDVDKILGLNIGADDYVTKPFNPLELVARVKSQLRRYTKLGNLPADDGENVYQVGGLLVNDDLKEVSVEGEPVKLTPIEYNILLLLVKNPGKVFSIEQIYESMRAHGKIVKAEAKEHALELLAKLNFKEPERIWESYPFEMSGGMNQRAGIAISMLMNPPVLFADEPTSALDVAVQRQVVQEMLHVRELFGTAIIIVTHDIGVVSAMADTVLVLKDGRKMEYGPAKEVLEHPQNDYTKELLSAVPKLKRS